jgi:hypothetical protein
MARSLQKSLRRIVTIGWLPLLWGCASFQAEEPITVKEHWLPYFKTCTPQDGAHTVQLFRDGHLLGAAELEWIASTDNNWVIEITNNLGQRLARIAGMPKPLKKQAKYPSNERVKLHSESLLLKKWPPVEKEPDGFLVVDDHWVGLKGDEVPCVLSGQLPLSWAKNLIQVEEDSSQISMEFADDERTLTAKIVSLPAAPLKREVALGESFPHIQICTTSSWTSFLFFKHSVQWCAVKYKKSKGATAKNPTLRGEYPALKQIEVKVDSPHLYRMLLTPLDSAPTAKTK